RLGPASLRPVPRAHRRLRWADGKLRHAKAARQLVGVGPPACLPVRETRVELRLFGRIVEALADAAEEARGVPVGIRGAYAAVGMRGRDAYEQRCGRGDGDCESPCCCKDFVVNRSDLHGVVVSSCLSQARMAATGVWATAPPLGDTFSPTSVSRS